MEASAQQKPTYEELEKALSSIKETAQKLQLSQWQQQKLITRLVSALRENDLDKVVEEAFLEGDTAIPITDKEKATIVKDILHLCPVSYASFFVSMNDQVAVQQTYGPGSQPVIWTGSRDDLIQVSIEGEDIPALLLDSDLRDAFDNIIDEEKKKKKYRQAGLFAIDRIVKYQSELDNPETSEEDREIYNLCAQEQADYLDIIFDLIESCRDRGDADLAFVARRAANLLRLLGDVSEPVHAEDNRWVKALLAYTKFKYDDPEYPNVLDDKVEDITWQDPTHLYDNGCINFQKVYKYWKSLPENSPTADAESSTTSMTS